MEGGNKKKKKNFRMTLRTTISISNVEGNLLPLLIGFNQWAAASP